MVVTLASGHLHAFPRTNAKTVGQIPGQKTRLKPIASASRPVIINLMEPYPTFLPKLDKYPAKINNDSKSWADWDLNPEPIA